ESAPAAASARGGSDLVGQARPGSASRGPWTSFSGLQSSPGLQSSEEGAGGGRAVRTSQSSFFSQESVKSVPTSSDDDKGHTPPSSSFKGKRKQVVGVCTDPEVVREHHGPLPPHQAKLFETVKTSVAHPSFSANRAKLEEIAQKHTKETGMRVGVSTEDVILEACREYSLGTMFALRQLSQRRLTNLERREAGIEVFDRRKTYGDAFNYCNIYAFSNERATLDMVDRWQTEMGVGTQLCGAVRSKIERHDWSGGVALRLLISGEGLPPAAGKYASTLLNPPTAARAKQPRLVNGRVGNDGPAWNVAAGMALVGGGALGTVGTETYVWKTGDPYRSSRELHEALLMLGFLGGLVWNPASVGLNQKVGGTFNDEQRSRG
ncbi:unnamed protein product, partial [Ectocarpus sp. 13 AM-2016]